MTISHTPPATSAASSADAINQNDPNKRQRTGGDSSDGGCLPTAAAAVAAAAAATTTTTDSRRTYHILILGASYGSLLASKFVLAGHRCTLICRSATARIFNEKGSIVRMPIRGREGLMEVTTKDRLRACIPDDVLFTTTTSNYGGGGGGEDDVYDLVVLAMQEPQYSSPDVRRLMLRVAAARLPVMAVTNMPLPPYLERIPALRGIFSSSSSSGGNSASSEIRACYTDPELWDAFIVPTADGRVGQGLFTQCSPDPQAFRPPDEPPNVLQVRLPTNFKAAAFGSGGDRSKDDPDSARIDSCNAMLIQLEGDIQKIEYSSEKLQLPVKLKVHDSIFVPLAKWAMLLAGNYRCIPPPVGGMNNIISIAQAVGGDVVESRRVYEWVNDLVVFLGGDANDDMVPFEKYLVATKSLQNPSSAARAVQGGAKNIERVDKVVQLIGRRRQGGVGGGLGRLDAVDDIVRNVDEWLARNKENENDGGE